MRTGRKLGFERYSNDSDRKRKWVLRGINMREKYAGVYLQGQLKEKYPLNGKINIEIKPGSGESEYERNNLRNTRG